jgi:iron(III) transport system ATP-binding protein
MSPAAIPCCTRQHDDHSAAMLEVRDVRHAFGSHEILKGVSFRLEKGRIGCLLGPSGCGKTTMLRCLAGFEPVTAGEILFDRKVVSAPGKNVPPEARRVGMVFQDFALFPHLDVLGNVAFGLRDLSRRARICRARQLLETVGLAGLESKFPHELSGGQQQRVALARALANGPEVLLLDEPFSNLDFELRERLGQELRDIIKRVNATAVLVTHDQHEAFAIADEIGIIADGRIHQWDTAYNLYHRPRTRFIADFVGQGMFLPGRVLASQEVSIELGMLKGEIPRICEIGCERCNKGCHVDVLLRPDDVIHDDASPLQAEVVQKAFRGAEFLYTLRLASGNKVLALVPSHHNHAIGERIGIRLAVDHIVAFAPELPVVPSGKEALVGAL